MEDIRITVAGPAGAGVAMNAHPGDPGEAWTATTILTGAPDRIRRQSPLLLLGEGTSAFAHSLLSHVLLRGERAIVLDGANGFDAYRLARVAQERQQTIPTLLTAVRVSRAFTWQQWLSLLMRDAEAEARKSGSTWIFALGILDLFADQDVKPFQAVRGAGQAAAALNTLAQAGLGVVAAQDRRILARSGRADLLEPLLKRAGRLLEISPAGAATGSAETPEFDRPPDPDSQMMFGFAELRSSPGLPLWS